MSSRGPHRTTLRAKILRRMDHMKEQNHLPLKGSFVDYDYLDEIYLENELELTLDDDHPTMPRSERDTLALAIRTRYRKIFAVLLIEEKTEWILGLHPRGQGPTVNDECLFQLPFAIGRAYEEESFPSHLLPDDLAEMLYQHQWIVPTRFSSTHHQHFPIKDFVFPYTSPPRQIGHGSYGIVCEVGIADQHIEYAPGSEYGPDTPKVYKQVRIVDHAGENIERVLNEVTTLRARVHPHITPLLASFSAGNDTIKDERENEPHLYMIMPLALGNLENWMRHEPSYLSETDQRQGCIYQMMLDIASGLAFIHKELDGRITHHHDLKPANILRFDRPDSNLPVWKISDFGGSHLKDVKDGSGTTYRAGTSRYAPPEFFTDNGGKHGRAFDIFSLAAVFLELATLWRYGWQTIVWQDDGQQEAGLDRLRSKVDTQSLETKAIPDPRKQPAYCKVMTTVVDTWIAQLENDSKAFCSVLKMIQEMFQSERGRRIFAWEVEIDLFCSIKQSEQSKQSKNTGPFPWEDVVARLESIIQRPRSGLPTHSPLARAIRLERPTIFQKVLEDNGWPTGLSSPSQDLPLCLEDGSAFLSTLELPKEGPPLYGRAKEVRWIDKQFVQAETFGLFGYGGVGKSHVALHYAERIMNETSLEHKRHTFWINADSKRLVVKSLCDIARKIGRDPHISDSFQVCQSVKTWLEAKQGGPWFLVVDGLDSREVAKEIVGLLPRQKSGPILVTARRSHVMDAIGCDEHRRWHLKSPGAEVRLNIFRHHLKYHDDDSQDTHELLEKLWLPLLIKMAAGHMNKYKKSKQSMREDFAQDSLTFNRIDEFDKAGEDYFEKEGNNSFDKPQVDFMTLFLKPLLPTDRGNRRTRSAAPWTPELKLLVFLSCLNPKKIGTKMIRANYDDADFTKLDRWLDTLMGCAFIERDGDAYTMHKFVQDGTMAWVRKVKGEKGLMHAWQNALAAILKCYEQRKKQESQANRLNPALYKCKRPFMAHFARFVTFTTSDAAKTGIFEFDLRAIICIEVFSQAYVEEGEYDKAIDVLEFAYSHCNGTYEPNKQNFQRVTRLLRTLAQAKIRRATENDVREAVSLLEDRLKELLQIPNMTPSDKPELKCLELDLLLDLVRLCWKCGHYPKAWHKLARFEPLDFRIGVDDIIFKDRDRLNPFLDRKCRNIPRLKLLAVRARHEKGLLQLAEVKDSSFQHWILARWMVRKRLENAKRTLIEAKHALVAWKKQEEQEELMDIDSSIADVNLKIGTPECLTEAETTLRERLDQQRTVFQVSQKSQWDTEYKLAELLLHQGNVHQVQEAMQILDRITDYHRDQFGSGNTETESCNNLLLKAKAKAESLNVTSNLDAEHGTHTARGNGPKQMPSPLGFDRMSLFQSIVLFYFVYISLSWWS